MIHMFHHSDIVEARYGIILQIQTERLDNKDIEWRQTFFIKTSKENGI